MDTGNLIEAKTGQEQHSSQWGKFYIHGLTLVVEDRINSRHMSYTCGALEVPDGLMFSIWDTRGDKHGTLDGNYYICITDSSAPEQEIRGGCYGNAAWCKGRFRILAHGAGRTKAPRLLNWVLEAGGIERVTPELAAHFAAYIDKRGILVPPPFNGVTGGSQR